MALAAFIASENGLGQEEWTEVALEASGTEPLVNCRVNRIGGTVDIVAQGKAYIEI